MSNDQKIKVITAKIGLDDHYRGIITVTEALRDAGMEVVYLGTGQRISGVTRAIVQEDANVVGLSFLCGGHLELTRQFMEKIRKENLERVMTVIGGVIPETDIPKLKALGVAEVFLPGTPLEDIVRFVSQNIK